MGLFSFLTKNKQPRKNTGETLPPLDMGLLHTDMHSHIIPGIDDGSKTMEMSVGLIRSLSDMGYKKIIATPHVQSDTFCNKPADLPAKLESVKEAVEKAGIDIELDLAAEFLLDDDIVARLLRNESLTFGNNYLLVELSMYLRPMGLEGWLFDLESHGYNLVLAHPERYRFWTQKPASYEKLKDRGILFQININSLAGFYDSNVRKTAEWLIDNNMVDFVGTDTHNERYIEGLQIARTMPYFHKIANSRQLLNNTL